MHEFFVVDAAEGREPDGDIIMNCVACEDGFEFRRQYRFPDDVARCGGTDLHSLSNKWKKVVKIGAYRWSFEARIDTSGRRRLVVKVFKNGSSERIHVEHYPQRSS